MSSPYANWSSTAYYNVGDIVQYNGSFFQALVANIGVTPVAGATWATFIPPSQLPAGLFNGVWGINVATGYAQAILTGVSPLLTSTSSLSCTLQTNTISAATFVDQETHWLITCIPSSANGGSITFILSAGLPTLPANFFVSWGVTKF